MEERTTIECIGCKKSFAIDFSKIPSTEKTVYVRCPHCRMELKRGNPNYVEAKSVLTRSQVRQYLNEGFKNSAYAKNNRVVENDATIKDLDFIEVLKNLFALIQNNYNSFVSSPNWTASERQKTVANTSANIANELVNNAEIKYQGKMLAKLCEDFYWESYDYFDDYKNQNEQICKEEVDYVLNIFEVFFKVV